MFGARSLRWIVMVVISLGFSDDLLAQLKMPPVQGDELANQVEEIKTSLFQKISKAVGGDLQVQQELVHDYLAPICLTIAILFVCYIVASNLARVVGELVSRRVDVTLGRFLTKASKIGMMSIVAMAVLEYNNISLTGFAAVIAAMGFAIGLALQGTMSNFAAGIMLMIFRPFKVDDMIVVNGIEGRVEEIDLVSTKINTRDNRHYIVPNSEIFGNRLENINRNAIRRVDVTVRSSYSADLKRTRAALESAIDVVASRHEINDGQVIMMELGADAIHWQLRVWTHPANYFVTRETLTEATKNAMDANGILIPYPQMDVHVVGKLMAKTFQDTDGRTAISNPEEYRPVRYGA